MRFSMLEIARSFPNISGGYVQEGNTPVVDPVSGGITQAPTGTGGFGTYPSAQIHLPIAKPHHGATITSVALYFYYGSSTGGTFSFSSGQITLQRVNVTTGAITSYGPSTACPTLAQNSAFTPYSVSITGLTVAVDLTAYVYRIMLQDVAQSGLPFYWTGGEVNYSGIANEEFSQ